MKKTLLAVALVASLALPASVAVTASADGTPSTTITCPKGKAPGWLDEHGNPTSCVDDDPGVTAIVKHHTKKKSKAKASKAKKAKAKRAAKKRHRVVVTSSCSKAVLVLVDTKRSKR